MEKQEIKEAIDVCDDLVIKLEDVLKDLKSAKNWALADLLFGDGMIGFFKRSKMEKAQSKLQLIKQLSQKLQKELSDIHVELEDFGDLYSMKEFMLDIVFDNPFTDWRIRKEINQVYDSTNEYLENIEMLRDSLTKEYNKL
ncbi:hypothetical protein [uncultured Finegoldia sp.]|uniref:hypothetical protein n=1 Tax=uncultured Finegoldia sp. TaxID=328009 RepID=UPI0026215C97|nr:hypothetical protein [uncultured Finegoldia sp.]